MGFVDRARSVLRVSIPSPFKGAEQLQILLYTIEAHSGLITFIINYYHEVLRSRAFKEQHQRKGTNKRCAKALAEADQKLSFIKNFLLSLSDTSDSEIIANKLQEAEQFNNSFNTLTTELVSVLTAMQDALIVQDIGTSDGGPPEFLGRKDIIEQCVADVLANQEQLHIIPLVGTTMQCKTQLANSIAIKVAASTRADVAYVSLEGSMPLQENQLMKTLLYQNCANFRSLARASSDTICNAYHQYYSRPAKDRHIVIVDEINPHLFEMLLPDQRTSNAVFICTSSSDATTFGAAALTLPDLSGEMIKLSLLKYVSVLEGATAETLGRACKLCCGCSLGVKLLGGALSSFGAQLDKIDAQVAQWSKSSNTIGLLIDHCVSLLSHETKSQLSLMTIFPKYFDLNALTSILGIDHEGAYTLIELLRSHGMLEEQPNNKLYRSYFLPQSIKEYCSSSLVTTAEERKKAVLQYIYHYKTLVFTMGWLYMHRSTPSTIALQMFDKESHNVVAVIQLLMEHITTGNTELISHALDLVRVTKELFAVRLDPELQLKWYITVRNAAVGHAKNMDGHHVFSVIDCSIEVSKSLTELGQNQVATQELEHALSEATKLQHVRAQYEANVTLAKLETNEHARLQRMKVALELVRKFDAVLEAHCLGELGHILLAKPQAQQALEKSVTTFKQYGMVHEQMTHVLMLGNHFITFHKNYLKAIELFESAMSLATSIKDSIVENYALFKIGFLKHQLSNDTSLALPYFEKYRAFFRTVPTDNEEYAFAMTELAAVNSVTGNNNEAKQNYEQALIIYQQTGNSKAQATICNNLASVLAVLGNKEVAANKLKMAIKLTPENSPSRGGYLYNLGNLYKDMGKYEQAVNTLLQSLQISKKLNETSKQVVRASSLAFCYANLHQMDTARQFFEEALSMVEPQSEMQVCIYHNMAAAYRVNGDLPTAQDYQAKALNMSIEINSKRAQAECRRGMGLTYVAQQNYSKAEELLQTALQICVDHRFQLLQMDILQDLAQLCGTKDGAPSKKSTDLLEQAAKIAKDVEHHREGELYLELGKQFRVLKDKAKTQAYFQICGTNAKKRKDMILLQKLAAELTNNKK